MELHLPPPHLVPYGLRAMKTLALANGALADAERAMMASAQRLFGTDIDIDGLDPIEPDELARHITDPALRRQIVRALTLLTLVDGVATRDEVDVVDGFARALEVASADLRVLRNLAEENLWRVRFDIGRRFWAREKLAEFVGDKGLGWLARAVAAMAGIAEDRRLAARYRALGDAPAGSLGRAYHDFIIASQFSFPGEKGSPPEVITLHDFTHVLSGYGTDPAGEMQVVAFHAGCRREEKDPFAFLMFGIVQFHVGVRLTPATVGHRGNFEPERVLRALRRGIACTIDPTDGWDPWQVMQRPLDELRAEYHIEPL